MTGLSVGFLVAGTGTRTSKLLGFAATGIGYQQGPVVLDEDVFDLLLGSLIHIFLVIGHQGFGDGLADGCEEDTDKKYISLMNTQGWDPAFRPTYVPSVRDSP